MAENRPLFSTASSSPLPPSCPGTPKRGAMLLSGADSSPGRAAYTSQFSDLYTDHTDQENDFRPFMLPMSSPNRGPTSSFAGENLLQQQLPHPSPPRNKRPRYDGTGSSSESEYQSPSRRKATLAGHSASSPAINATENASNGTHIDDVATASSGVTIAASTHLVWERGNNFMRVIPMHRALRGREIYAARGGRRIIPTMRKQAQQFASTERDVFRIGDALGINIPPFALAFSNVANDGKFLAIADEDGAVGLIDGKHDNTWEEGHKRVEWNAHENAIFDIAWTADDTHLVTASGDQTARVWNVETRKVVKIFRGHGCSIKSVTGHAQNPHIFATAGRDGRIMIWDTRSFAQTLEDGMEYLSPYAKIADAHVNALGAPSKKLRAGRPSWGNQPHGVTAVKFMGHGQDVKLVSSGAADGKIKIWDMRYITQRHPTPSDSTSSIKGKRLHGFSSFSLNSSGSRLYAASTDHNVYEFHTSNLSLPARQLPPAAQYRCRSFYVKTAVSPDDRFVASGSSNGGLYMWEIDDLKKPPLLLNGHEGEVTTLSWCAKDPELLASCADDMTIRLWRQRPDCEELKEDPMYKSIRGFAVEAAPRLPRSESKTQTIPITPAHPVEQDENVTPIPQQPSETPTRTSANQRETITSAPSRRPTNGSASRSSIRKTPRNGSGVTLGSSSVKRRKSRGPLETPTSIASKAITDYFVPSSEMTDDERL
ncbi:hypothetical protein HK097_005284 [Rhizophlyctis rosea]|uniref:WD40 repeat-like protein n=1 Tax=Rhizophlyctis rosea TaxID=64517 RepID=A0AAD5SLC1_9FUNG|nr:hypothetical protein HK097_005284 [Rhizophlyctis rosea]